LEELEELWELADPDGSAYDDHASYYGSSDEDDFMNVEEDLTDEKGCRDDPESEGLEHEDNQDEMHEYQKFKDAYAKGSYKRKKRARQDRVGETKSKRRKMSEAKPERRLKLKSDIRNKRESLLLGINADEKKV
jgi:hypothetical protein